MHTGSANPSPARTPSAGEQSHFTAHLAALGAFFALTLASTWPLGRHLTSRVGPDAGDPLLNTWILWWNSQALPFTERWWNPPVFFPIEGAFALSEHLAGIALFTTPLQLLGASPLLAYNIALLLSFTLSAFSAYLLVYYLLVRAGAPHVTVIVGALCAGVAFGFAPYRAGHLSHLQVLTTQWMPLALLAMHAYLDGGRRRWLVVLGCAWVVQALSNGYYMLFFPVLVVLWLGWFVDWSRQWRRALALVGAYSASSLLLLPGLWQYLAVHRQLGLGRRIDEMRMFSGDLAAFVTPPPNLAFWPDLAAANQETLLFPGVTALLLVGLAAVLHRRRASGARRVPFRRSPGVFYGLAMLVMWWLAMGPALPGEGPAGLARLYTLVAHLPGFGSLRVPARFAMLGYMCLAIAGGLALARVLPASSRGRIVVTALVCTGLFVDGWTNPMPLVPPAVSVMLPEATGAAVLELPADAEDVNVASMYRSMRHGYPLVNGYSGHVPTHYRILRDRLRRGDHTVLTTLAARHPLLVAVHSNHDPDGHFQRVVEALPGAEMIGVINAGRLFFVPAQPSEAAPPRGDALPHTFTAPAEDVAELDLGAPHVVRVVEILLGAHYGDLHSRLEIRASGDGERWTTVWLEWTGGRMLTGALEDQREVPLRITLPDVRTRYLRVRPLPPALLREVRVYAPR